MPKLDSDLRCEVQTYLKENNATKEERATVWRMVHEGQDHLANPWLYAFEGGFLMDLVSALRFDQDLQDWYESMTAAEREEMFSSHGPTMEEVMAGYDNEDIDR